MPVPHLHPDAAALTTALWRRPVRDTYRLTAVVNMAATTFQNMHVLKCYSCPCQCGATRDEKELLRVSGHVCVCAPRRSVSTRPITPHGHVAAGGLGAADMSAHFKEMERRDAG